LCDEKSGPVAMVSKSDILNAGILIVDDQQPNVLLLERMLRGAGYVSIDSTTDPNEVCELHSKNHYDLILLDLQMPGMDGFQVMEGLKELETGGYLPVLVITAQPDHKLRALTAGAKDFVSKPFDLAEVLARVYNMLEVRLLHLETKHLYERAEEHSRALESDLRRAAEIQRALLPRQTPSLAGFELAASCIPAREVGGDFYDWRLYDSSLSLSLGDVMGKGIPAALLMATVVSSLRSIGGQTQPSVAIRSVSRTLESYFDGSGSFATLFHGRLDLARQRLSYVDAGHGLVFVRRADGSVEDLRPRSFPLGTVWNSRYRGGSTTIRAGDVLVAYSDGLAETQAGFIDQQTLACRIEGATSAQEMVDALCARPESAPAPSDDLTVLVLSCTE
jgi:sigma-B regulation protein RsbU (phosphoserine phosphatase)